MQYSDKKDWTEEDVNTRTKYLSELLYNKTVLGARLRRARKKIIYT